MLTDKSSFGSVGLILYETVGVVCASERNSNFDSAIESNISLKYYFIPR